MELDPIFQGAIGADSRTSPPQKTTNVQVIVGEPRESMFGGIANTSAQTSSPKPSTPGLQEMPGGGVIAQAVIAVSEPGDMPAGEMTEPTSDVPGAFPTFGMA